MSLTELKMKKTKKVLNLHFYSSKVIIQNRNAMLCPYAAFVYTRKTKRVHY